MRTGDLSFQAMLLHRFPIAAQSGRNPISGVAYFAGYEGDPENTDSWVSAYLTGHVPLMQQFAAVREIEVYTRLDRCPIKLPLRQHRWMLRNMVLFDTPDDLEQALHSPVRRALRAHRASMPGHGGANEHFAALSQSIQLARQDENHDQFDLLPIKQVKG
jgi:hypothetical protein